MTVRCLHCGDDIDYTKDAECRCRCSTPKTETCYTVTCDDCDLFEIYKYERIARGHRQSHWEDIRHVATVEQAEMYVCGTGDTDDDR